MIRRIDAHQHFWDIARGDYHWMTDAVAPIRRTILPADLQPHLARHGIDGTVLVQAAASVEETEFLLHLAQDHAFIRGVVGWVDLEDPAAPDTLGRLARSPKFKGVRPMLQDIGDPDWIARPAVIANLRVLSDMGLRFDALITPRHLGVMARVAAGLPDLPIVIDHCAKPDIAGGSDPGGTWRAGIADLAALPHVHCKMSGLANESRADWSAERLRATADHVLEVFGPGRVMWGSDWPVLDLVGSYTEWHDAAETLVASLPATARDRIFGQNAAAFYGLGDTCGSNGASP